jgi:hypothetical protein
LHGSVQRSGMRRAWIFNGFFYGLSHCAFATRSRKVYVHSFSSKKERTKKADQRLQPLETAPPAVLTMNGGNFYFGKCFPSWAHKRTPKMGLLLAKAFAVPFCSKFMRTRARSRWQKTLSHISRAPFVLAFFHQNANAKSESAHLRKNIGGAKRQQFLRAPRVPRGNPLVPFLRLFFAARQRIGTRCPQARAAGTVRASGFAPGRSFNLKTTAPRSLPCAGRGSYCSFCLIQ